MVPDRRRRLDRISACAWRVAANTGTDMRYRAL
jgi:hypothetical protein